MYGDEDSPVAKWSSINISFAIWIPSLNAYPKVQHKLLYSERFKSTVEHIISDDQLMGFFILKKPTLVSASFICV